MGTLRNSTGHTFFLLPDFSAQALVQQCCVSVAKRVQHPKSCTKNLTNIIQHVATYRNRVAKRMQNAYVMPNNVAGCGAEILWAFGQAFTKILSHKIEHIQKRALEIVYLLNMSLILYYIYWSCINVHIIYSNIMLFRITGFYNMILNKSFIHSSFIHAFRDTINCAIAWTIKRNCFPFVAWATKERHVKFYSLITILLSVIKNYTKYVEVVYCRYFKYKNTVATQVGHYVSKHARKFF